MFYINHNSKTHRLRQTDGHQLHFVFPFWWSDIISLPASWWHLE